MKNLQSLLIAALVTCSTLLHAQDTPPPDPAPQPTTEVLQEPSPAGSTADQRAGAVDTVEIEPEVLGPPAPPEYAGGQKDAKSDRTVNFNYSYSASPGTFKYHVKSDNGEFSFDGSFLQGYWFSPFMLVVRSGLLVLWVALGCATAAIFQPAIARTQTELRQAPGRSAALGFLWIISFWILLLAGVVMALVLIGLPFILIVLVFDLALRVFGLTVTFAVVGEWIAERLNRPGVSIYAAVFIGACVLGLLRLVPIAGTFIWFAAALFGVGATLATRFGSSSNPPALGYPIAPAPMAPATA